MTWRFLFALSLVSFAAGVNNSRCFECIDLPLPLYCTHVTECAPGQKCAVESFVTSSGLVLYNTVCLSEYRCSQNGRSYRSDVIVCENCCEGDFCNHQGCGFIAEKQPQRGPLCFQCEYENEPDQCRTIVQCGLGEVCMLRELDRKRPDGKPLYRSSCAKQLSCHAEANIHSLMGKKSGTHCYTCCTEDFCNDKCPSAKVSAPTTPVTSPTTPLTTSSTTTMPTTTTITSTTEPITSSTTTMPTTTTISTTETTTPSSTTMPTTTGATTKYTASTVNVTDVYLKLYTTQKPSSTTLGFADICHQHHYRYIGSSQLCVRIYATKRSWDDAYKRCKQDGGLLAVIDTEAKWNSLKYLLIKYFPDEHVYIGGRDTGHHDNDFHWTNGAKVEFTDWGGGQPEGGHENCVYVRHSDHHRWHDTECDRKLAYVCTISPH